LRVVRTDNEPRVRDGYESVRESFRKSLETGFFVVL